MAKKTTDKGPKPLRGIRNPDLYPQQKGNVEMESARNLSQAAYNSYNSFKGNIGWDSIKSPDAFEEKHYTPDNPLWKVGQSTWDDDIMVNATPEDIQDARAHNQPWWSQWGSGTLKMLGTAGTTVVDGTVGLLAGIIQGVQNTLDDDTKTGFVDGLWNNKVTNAMAEVSEAMEEALPNYMSQWEQNAPFWQRMFSGEGGANFWANDILKNAGFTIGAAASIYLTGGLGGALGKSLSGLGKMAKLTNAAGDLTKAGKFAKWTANTFASTIGEASTEALNTYRDNKKLMDLNLSQRRNSLREKALAEYQQSLAMGVDPAYADTALKNKLAKIETDVANYEKQQEATLLDASNAVLGANMAVLALSNNLTLGSMIRGGYGNAKSLLQRAVKTVDGKPVTETADIARGMLNNTLRYEAQNIEHGTAKTIGRWALGSTQEGLEEGAQNLASSTAQINTQAKMNKWAREYSTLGSQINPDATEELADWTKALGKAYEENFGTASSQGWTEVAAGFISGMLGVASVHRNKEGKVRPTWQGGLKEAHESIYGEKEATERAAQGLQEALTNGKFGERVKNAVQNLAIKSKMDEALEKGDARGFKNAEVEQLVSNALYARDMGLLDSYMEMFDELSKGVDDSTLTELRALAKDMKGESSIDSLTDDEVKKKYQDKAKSTKEKLQKALDEYDAADKQHGDKFSNETRKAAVHEISFKNTLLWDTYRRIKELQDEVDNINAKGAEATPSENTQKAEKENAIKSLEKQAKAIREQLNDYTSHPEKLQKEIENALNTARKQALYREADKAIAKYKEATTVADILDIYDNSPEEQRNEVLKQAEEQAEGETKEKIKQFRGFMEDSQVIADQITEMFPLDNEETFEADMSKARFAYQVLNQAMNEILHDDSPTLTRENFKDKLTKVFDDLKAEQEEYENIADGVTYDEETNNASWADAEINEDDVEYNLDEDDNSVASYKEGSDLEKRIIAAVNGKGSETRAAIVEELLNKLEKIDDLRKAGKKPDPKKSPRGKGKTGKKTVIETSKGETVEEEDLIIDDDEDDDSFTLDDEDDVPVEDEGVVGADSSNTLLNEKEQKMYDVKQVKGSSGVTYNVVRKSSQYDEASKEEGKNTVPDRAKNIGNALIDLKDKLYALKDSLSDKKYAEESKKLIKKFIKEVENSPIGENLMEKVENFFKDNKVTKPADKTAAPAEREKHAAEEAKALDKTDTSLNGVTFTPYVKSKLKSDQRLIEYTPKGKIQEVLKDLGIDLLYSQDVIVPSLVDKDKDKAPKDKTPVYYLHTSKCKDTIVLGVKASDVKTEKPVKTIKVGEEEYVVIGTLGYDEKYRPETKGMYTNLIEEIQKNHSDEGWYVHDKTNRIKDYTTGHIIVQDINDSEPQSRSLAYMFEHRNPQGITAENAKWLVVYGDEKRKTPEYVNLDIEKETAPMPENALPGQVYIYIKDKKGNNVPIQIETAFYADIEKDLEDNPEHPLVKWTAHLMRTLADPEASMEEKVKAKTLLNDYFVFSKANIFHVNVENNKVSPNSIWVTINGRSKPVIDFNNETSMEENLDALKKALSEMNPRIAINTKTLKNSPQDYIDAGLVRTLAATLETKGSEFFLYPTDNNNEFVVNKPHKATATVTFNSKEKFNFNKGTYYTDGEKFFDSKLEPIVDKDGTLAMAWSIKQGKVTAIKTEKTTYYRDGAMLYADNGHGGLMLLSKSETKKAEKIIEKEKNKKKREAKIKEAKEKGEGKEVTDEYKEGFTMTHEYPDGRKITAHRTFKISDWSSLGDKKSAMSQVAEKLKGTEAEWHFIETVEPDGSKHSEYEVRRNPEDDFHSPEALLEILKGTPANAEELFGLDDLTKPEPFGINISTDGTEKIVKGDDIKYDGTFRAYFSNGKGYLTFVDIANIDYFPKSALLKYMTERAYHAIKAKGAKANPAAGIVDAKGNVIEKIDVPEDLSEEAPEHFNLYLAELEEFEKEGGKATLQQKANSLFNWGDSINLVDAYNYLLKTNKALAEELLKVAKEHGRDLTVKGKGKSNFVNGTNIDELKSAKDLEKSKISDTFVAELASEENADKLDELYDTVEDKFGIECANMGELIKVLQDKKVDTSSNNIDTVLEILKNCR